MEDVPWECSKALIILKQGFQAIIPREASRSILLGEASYTLIDDNGVEFFLSPKDKQRRRAEGKSTEMPKKKVTLSDEVAAELDEPVLVPKAKVGNFISFYLSFSQENKF